MNRSKIKQAIDKEIKKECAKKGIEFSNLKLDQNFNLIDSGIFDSLGILQLIATLEGELNANVDLSEYSPSEFTNYQELIFVVENSMYTSKKSLS